MRKGHYYKVFARNILSESPNSVTDLAQLPLAPGVYVVGAADARCIRQCFVLDVCPGERRVVYDELSEYEDQPAYTKLPLVDLEWHFHAMLDAVCSLATQYIVLPDEPSSILHENPKFGTPFAYCRLAFDGTHIPAFVSASKAKPFRNRNGKLTQNVFAACTFDMKFAFVLCGWEGSAADPTVLADARRRGFTTPKGLFDLGDA
ncbi:hypothetical protein Poli38472_013559 [Pythium oligandrum]|uniref:DDE Tnp4 domain-containing protein n=1 Tax=Pythium oligandrum TaxID=41045 RepID=A0A8K1FFZ6_PYTOL|nr:hypothetical protein Poli38472_013559 [Pythium oligandrum]|eukprot:TMW61096.1 hypothetical protein Poli38472_013559 [Pythium oligandrum]